MFTTHNKMPETDQEVISTGDSQGEFQTMVLKKLPTLQSQWKHKEIA